jgi:hypothetical protein
MCVFGDDRFGQNKKAGERLPRKLAKRIIIKIRSSQKKKQDNVMLIDACSNIFYQTNRNGNHNKKEMRTRSEMLSRDPWRNSVLVVVCLRLGMNKVQTEFMNLIRSFFMQNLNVGILGGRAGQSCCVVGIQDDYLIFLDPHNTQEAIPANIIKFVRST